MRKRISDNNIFPNFSIEHEYSKLQTLFQNQTVFGYLVGPLGNDKARPSISYEECFKSMFLDWSLRGTTTSYSELLEAFSIRKEDFSNKPSKEKLLDFIQFLLNAVIFVNTQVGSHRYKIYKTDDTIFKAIVDNCNYLLNELNAEFKIDENTKEVFVVYKDDVASAISEEYKDLSSSIVEYLKIDNNGDLQRKGEVLSTLAKRLEPYESELRGTEFACLCTDTTFLLNNIGVRHYVDPDKKITAQFTSMSKDELEKWYDRTFDMFLACIAVIPYVGYKAEIKQFKNV